MAIHKRFLISLQLHHNVEYPKIFLAELQKTVLLLALHIKQFSQFKEENAWSKTFAYLLLVYSMYLFWAVCHNTTFLLFLPEIYDDLRWPKNTGRCRTQLYSINRQLRSYLIFIIFIFLWNFGHFLLTPLYFLSLLTSTFKILNSQMQLPLLHLTHACA